ncbi:MAG: ribosome-associated translation inhibitor RaiA [Pseudomonadales bacterium]|nr:ribosome-associated translation inhibitor RaiA [Pseudomonadales bacterium]NRA17635.1 ribosome-associated translation inhibitor RaiA [Oceanospirillaceae bacterium]
MIINITHRNDKVSPAVKDKIESWLKHSQHRYDIINSAQITIDSTERAEAIEATLHTNGKEIYAKTSATNLYAAIDSLTDKIDRQLAKAKEKMSAKKGGPRHLEPIPEPITAADLEAMALEE